MRPETRLERPMLKPWFRVAWPGGRCVLEYGGTAFSLEGAAATRLLPVLLPLLDGQRTREQVIAGVGHAARPAVERALEVLARAGVLTEGPPAVGLAGPEAATVEILAAGSPATGPAEILALLSERRVGLFGSGAVADETARVLGSSGVERIERFTPEGPNGPLVTALAGMDLVVAAPSPAELDALEDLNRLALERAFPWLVLLPFDGSVAFVGPLYVPGETCCHRCFLLRRASTSGYREELAALDGVPARYGLPPAHASTIAGLGSWLALRWIVLGDAELPGRLYALEQWPAVRLTRHHVYRVPRCSECSPAGRLAPPAPWHEADP